MMGRTHAISGTTAWACTVALARLAGIHPRPSVVAAGMLTAAGAALLPDLDHPDATIAHTFGHASKAAASFVHRVAGGHRQATHSIGFIGFCFAMVWLGAFLLGPVFACPVMFALAGFAFRALHVRRHTVLPLAAAVALLAGVNTSVHAAGRLSYSWLPLAVALGAATHLFGDCLTPEGCPLLWPRTRRHRLPLIAHTDHWIERRVFAPACVVATIALCTIPW